MPRHHYSAGVIWLFLCGMLKVAISQRGMAALFTLFAPMLPTPVANTGRLWLLRFGLYELIRPKQHATDWVWIMDHTIQLGPWKCLIILGVRLSDWAPDYGPLEHEDMALLNLTPMESSSGEKVEEQMRATLEQTGEPREILTDGGSDLIRGFQLFSKDRPRIALIRDIKHKGATLLKHNLEADPRWARFVTQSNQTKLQVTQTSLAFLNPPSLKRKARYMNLDTLVRWGRDALAFLDCPQAVSGEPLDYKGLEKKLGWLREYREAMEEWSELLALVETAVGYVRQKGFHLQAAEELRSELTPLAASTVGQEMQKALVEFVGEQSAYAGTAERLVGSSEVIESVIGKYKRLQSTHSQGGTTGMILSVGAIVREKTSETIREALTGVTTHAVLEWCARHLGTTLQAQRRLAFSGNKNEIQTTA